MTHDDIRNPVGMAGTRYVMANDGTLTALGTQAQLAPDAINPPHYKKPGAVEVVDVIRQQLGDAGFVAYCRGNALKYLARAGAKPGQPAAQDFAKSAWFARMAAHALEPGAYVDPRT